MKKTLSIKKICAALMAVAGVGLTSGQGQAQASDTFPTKAIKLVVPFAPGGVTDTSGHRRGIIQTTRPTSHC